VYQVAIKSVHPEMKGKNKESSQQRRHDWI